MGIASSLTTTETGRLDTTSSTSSRSRLVDTDGCVLASTTRDNWSSTWTVFNVPLDIIVYDAGFTKLSCVVYRSFCSFNRFLLLWWLLLMCSYNRSHCCEEFRVGYSILYLIFYYIYIIYKKEKKKKWNKMKKDKQKKKKKKSLVIFYLKSSKCRRRHHIYPTLLCALRWA